MKNLSNENSSNKLDKKVKTKLLVEKHANLLKSIFKIKNSMIIYIDEAKNSQTTDAATVCFFNAKTTVKNWNSGRYIDVIDAELFAIEKAIEFCAKRTHSVKIASDI